MILFFLPALYFPTVLLAGKDRPRPLIPPFPLTVSGVETPVMNLNGVWKFSLEVPEKFWLEKKNLSGWTDIQVPGEALMQGYNIKRDIEYPYKRLFHIPGDFQGKKIFLRFDGVYSHARVWVNGNFIRDHHGGFTSWCCDITEQVVPGKSAWITVGVTDRADDISWGSEYAKHNIGGILRDVTLFALPENYLQRFHVDTFFDSSYTDAVMKVTASVAFQHEMKATIRLSLSDPQGEPVPFVPDSLVLSSKRPQAVAVLPVAHPRKWDAEHPNLYTLEASLVADGVVRETLSRKVGFRNVERLGNKLYVNGKEIKLRGVNRHETHPTRGRSITAELAAVDVRLFREANVNFVRTSHYPPSEAFLDACDRYGMYVEEETAVCFVGTWSDQATSHNPAFASRYMEQFAEMIERDRSHPSVIIWSLGNESEWGENFRMEYDYLKDEDPARPAIFSYPEKVPAGVVTYDIYSVHYADYKTNLGSQSILYPVLHDEMAHVACYNVTELRRDPGVRDFWGESIKAFAENVFTTDGALGAAIWAGIDDCFQLPPADNELPAYSSQRSGFNKYGYGEWGIIDGWRRRKPEFWLVKKAYSPVRIKEELLPDPGSGNILAIPVENRFDHTNLSELSVLWRAGADSGRFRGPDVKPHSQGLLTIPAGEWKDSGIINLRFFRLDTLLVDEYNLPLGYQEKKFPEVQGRAPSISEDQLAIAVTGDRFRIEFSKATGLITRGVFKGSEIIKSGPYLNLIAVDYPDWSESGLWDSQNNELTVDREKWSLGHLSSRADSAEAIIEIDGGYGKMKVSFEVRIDGKGLITTNYKIGSQLDPPPKQGYSEIGVIYVLAGEIDRLTWERNGLWSAYPSDHIGRNSGLALKLRKTGKEKYGVQPDWPWAEDMADYYLFGRDDQGGRGTNDFRSMKANILFGSAILAGTENRVRAESDGAHALRLEISHSGNNERINFIINNYWNYPSLKWGNFMEEPLYIGKGYRGMVKMRLTDNDNYL